MKKKIKKRAVRKIKCYVLDFGDTNLISEEKQGILDWISTDIDSMGKDGLHYEITTKMLTRAQINRLPEWS